jgi:hypothetical protein
MNVPGASHSDITDPAFPGQAVPRLREDGLAVFSGFRDRASLAEAARAVMAARPHRDAGPGGVMAIAAAMPGAAPGFAAFTEGGLVPHTDGSSQR